MEDTRRHQVFWREWDCGCIPAKEQWCPVVQGILRMQKGDARIVVSIDALRFEISSYKDKEQAEQAVYKAVELIGHHLKKPYFTFSID